MYIQPSAGEAPLQLPKDYHGHAFMQEKPPDIPPPEAVQVQESEQEEPAPEARAEDVPAFKGMDRDAREDRTHGGGRSALGSGLLSRFPLLSSLLPPPRERGKREKEGGDLVTWVLIGLAVLLFLDERSDDILPLLLLLLLWD